MHTYLAVFFGTLVLSLVLTSLAIAWGGACE